MRYSEHVFNSAKKRWGLKKKSLIRITQDLFTLGLPRKAAKGSLRKYMDAKYYDPLYNNCEVIFSRGYIFIIGDKDKLITLYKIPKTYESVAFSQWNKYKERKEGKVSGSFTRPA